MLTDQSSHCEWKNEVGNKWREIRGRQKNDGREGGRKKGRGGGRRRVGGLRGGEGGKQIEVADKQMCINFIRIS